MKKHLKIFVEKQNNVHHLHLMSCSHFKCLVLGKEQTTHMGQFCQWGTGTNSTSQSLNNFRREENFPIVSMCMVFTCIHFLQWRILGWNCHKHVHFLFNIHFLVREPHGCGTSHGCGISHVWNISDDLCLCQAASESMSTFPLGCWNVHFMTSSKLLLHILFVYYMCSKCVSVWTLPCVIIF